MSLAKLLDLTRPLIIVDTETTGTDVEQDRIWQIGLETHYPDGAIRSYSTRLNPTVPLSKFNIEEQGVTDADLADKPTFAYIANNLYVGFQGKDFAGYHVRFDIGILCAELKRCKLPWDPSAAKIIDAYRIWQELEKRTLADAVRVWAGREPTDSHTADGDVLDTRDTLIGMFEAKLHIPLNVAALHQMCWPDQIDLDGKFKFIDGVPCVAFGKHKDTPIVKLSRGYLTWMAGADFTASTKKVVTDALNGIIPKPR